MVRKIFLISVLFAVAGMMLFSAFPVFAADEPVDSCTLLRAVTIGTVTKNANAVVNATTSNWGAFCFINSLNVVTNYVFIALFVLAALLIAIAGFLFITAGGDPEKTKKAQSMVLYAVIGIVVALLARVIPNIASSIVG